MSAFLCPIVGAKFRPPALGVLSALGAGHRLLVRREPQNPHDANALAVLVEPSSWAQMPELRERLERDLPAWGSELGEVELRGAQLHLGYIPRDQASEIAPLFDRASVSEREASLAFSPEGSPRVRFELDGGG